MLWLVAVWLVAASGQFQQPAQRQLLLLVQDIQNQLQLPQQVRRVIVVDPAAELPQQLQSQVQPQLQQLQFQVQPQLQQLQSQVQPQLQQLQPRFQAQRERQKPRANSTGAQPQPQFLEPGVGRWLLNDDQACLPCICEAASGCDEALGCDERGFCGPFLLSRRYWTLAGKPLLRGDSADRPGASSDCLRDSFCAAEAVRGYLDRFAQDCDGDRRVDCFDLARVHFQGPFNCRAPLQPPNDFSETFRRCWDASRRNKLR